MRKNIPFYVLLVLCLYSCGNDTEQFSESMDTIPSIDATTRNSTPNNNPTFVSRSEESIKTFLQFFGQDDFISIEPDAQQLFIAPILEENSPYHHSPSNDYTYGDLIYKNEHFAAVTFEYESLLNEHDLSALFLVTYNLKNGQFIDYKIIEQNSTLDFRDSKGYTLKIIEKYQIDMINKSSTAFKISTQSKKEFSRFNKAIVSNKANEINQNKFIVDKNGIIEFI